MAKQNELFDLSDMLRAAWRFWPLVLAITVVFGSAALLISLSEVRLFSCQTLVALPEAGGGALADTSAGQSRTLFSVAETRALLADFPLSPDGDGGQWKRRLHSIRLSQSGSAGVYFNMLVVSREEPAAAVAISERALQYLQGQPEVKDRIDRMRRGWLEEKSILEGALERLSRIKGRTAADLAAIEAGTARTKILLSRVEDNLSELRTYRFVAPPILNPVPVAPKPVVRAAAFSIIGFLLGIFAASALDSIKKRERPLLPK